MLLAKDVMDVQQDVLVHVKQFVSLFVRVVQANVKIVMAVQLVMVVKIIQLVLDVILHVLAVLAVIRVVQQDVKLDVLVLVKLDVQVNVKAVQDVQAVLVV